MDFDSGADQQPLPLPGRTGDLVAPKESRGDQPYDTAVADFIQRYAIAAVRCFEKRENPTLALMALRPFKVGSFDLATELQTLLFDDGQTAEETLNKFRERFREITSSIPLADQQADSPYLIEYAIGLQMLVYAALARADMANVDDYGTFNLLLSLESVHTRVHSPALKLVKPKHTNEETSKYVAYQPQSSQLLGESKAKNDELQEITERGISKTEIDRAANLVQQSKLDQALTQLEPMFRSQQLLDPFFTQPTYFFGLDRILAWLTEPASVNQQTFALKVLNRILQNADEANILFENTDSAFFKALLAFKPQNPESTLELGKLFRTLAGYAGAYRPEFRALLDSRMEQAEAKISHPNRNKFIAVGVLFGLATVAAVFSIIFFPLLPLYAGITISIAAGVFGLAALSTLARAFFSKEPVSVQKIPSTPEEPSRLRPMIQTNFKTWLEAYGYDPAKLNGEALVNILEQAPHLSNSVNIIKDAPVFASALAEGDWSIFQRLVFAFDWEARSKMSEIVIELGGKCFRDLVTDLEKLKIFCSYLPLDDEANRNALSRYIFKKSDYLAALIKQMPTDMPPLSSADTDDLSGNDDMQEIDSSSQLYQSLIRAMRLRWSELEKQQDDPSQYHHSPLDSPAQIPKGSDSTGQAPDLGGRLGPTPKSLNS